MKIFREKIFFVFALVGMMFYSCQKSDDVVNNENKKDKKEDKKELKTEDNKDLVLTEDVIKSVAKSNTKFAFNFFKRVSDSETKDNFMVSPLSLSMALGMAYNGSNGSTKESFDKVLNYTQSIAQNNQFNKDLISRLSSNVDGSIMKIANSIWIKEGFPVKDEFISVNKRYFDAKVSKLDFGDSSSKETINKWVYDKTEGKIKQIIDKINSSSVMFLINALYFKSNWKYKFDDKLTKDAPFYHNDTEQVQVKMMEMKGNIAHLKNDLFESVILPYKGDKFSMVILLPNSGKTTSDIIKEMNSDNWKNWLDAYKNVDIKLRLPKFKLEYKNKLKDELTKMGLEVAFSSRSDFSKISDIPTKISEVLQKTFIEVNEEGTEAAAVTAVDTRARIAISIPTFTANKPFVYLIKENKNSSICFMGKIAKPTY